MKRWVWLALGTLACAGAPPRPRVLTEIEQVQSSPAVQDARQSSPQAYAHAEDLRRRAEAAQKSGDSAGAQILAEHALAAFEHAVVLARLTRSEARRGDAEARLARAQAEQKALDEQEQRVRAETENLELRARVLTDTLPLPENAPAAREREQARLEAARALSLQARLLCVSARLLEPGRQTLTSLFAELESLDGRLAKRPAPTPVDDAVHLRSRCLSELTQVRRPATLREPARAAEDRLLSELSNAAYGPSRDERGIVVTLRGIFENAGLSTAAAKTIQALGRVAQSHPDFPVLVVLHTATAGSPDRDRQRLERVLAALKESHLARVDGALGGNSAPIVDPHRPGAGERNERVEVVFVAPSSG